jgi:hypothetical protein
MLLSLQGKCDKQGMQCSKTEGESTGMEAENVAKKHLRGASVASLIPISALGFFATKPARNGSASLYTKKYFVFI